MSHIPKEEALRAIDESLETRWLPAATGDGIMPAEAPNCQLCAVVDKYAGTCENACPLGSNGYVCCPTDGGDSVFNRWADADASDTKHLREYASDMVMLLQMVRGIVERS